MGRRRVDPIEQIRSRHALVQVNCKNEACLRFKDCAQLASQFRRISSDTADIAFLFDSPTSQDTSKNLMATSNAGLFFREQFLMPFFTASGSNKNYLITSVTRAARPTDGDETSEKEIEACFEHLKRELLQFRPRLVVVFGLNPLMALYNRALNRNDFPQDGLKIAFLRNSVWRIQLTKDYAFDLLVTYSPGYIQKTPAATRFLLEDRDKAVAYFKEEKEKKDEEKGIARKPKALRATVTIDQIETAETEEEALSFIESLINGHPEVEANGGFVAFDTETMNLNRRYNNAFLTFQFSYKPGHAYVIPIEHPERPLFYEAEAKARLVKAMNRLFNAPKSQTKINWWIAHSAKFDLSVLFGLLGVLPRQRVDADASPWWCTHYGMHWLDENRKGLKMFMEGQNPYSLKTLGKEFFGFRYRAEHLEKRHEGSLIDLGITDLSEYGGSDTILTRALFFKQKQLAYEQPDDALPILEKFMHYYYWPSIRSVAMMECSGIYTAEEHVRWLQGEDSPIWNRIYQLENIEIQNRPEVIEYRKQFSTKMGKKNKIEYEPNIWSDGTEEEVEVEINIDTLPFLDVSKETQKDLFYTEHLKFPPLKFSKKTEDPSFDKGFLEHYSQRSNFFEHESTRPYRAFYSKEIGKGEKGEPRYEPNAFELILELTKLKKLGTTYCNGLEKLLLDRNGDCIDARIRASFNLAGTDTGRLASSKPNFQNLPSGKNKAAKEIKNMFQAEPPSERWPEGTILLQVDYAAAEVFWAVNFSREPELVKFLNHCADSLEKAFEDSDALTDDEFEAIVLSTDFHKRTASLMFGIPAEEVLKPMRQASKSITFGLLYGKGVKSLSEENGWTEEEGQQRVDQFFSAFPKLKQWLEKQKTIARERGYVATMMGRRRRLRDYYQTKDFRQENDADRKAMNSPIQGQSSDAGVIGLNNFVQVQLDNNLEKEWLVQNVVHDSILFQIPWQDIRRALPTIKYCLTTGMKDYIEEHFGVKVPVTLRCDFELGIRYGDFENWDQRPKTLEGVLEKVRAKADVLWPAKSKNETEPLSVGEGEPVKPKLRRPSAMLDLVRWEGGV